MDSSGPTSRKVLRMESKGDPWRDMQACRGLSAASVLENQGSRDFSSYDGSLPSCSPSSCERNSSKDHIDRAATVRVSAMLHDAKVRAVLRKVTINESVLRMTIQSLGGGKKGLQSLVGYIMVWMKQQRVIQSLPQQPPPPPACKISSAQDVFLQPSSDAFQILSDVLQSPPTTQPLDQEMRMTHQRLKSRKLTTGESEMGGGLGGSDTGLCLSSFVSSREDCKPEVTSRDTMPPHSPQQRVAMPPTSAMTTKAARRHRMPRQRQPCHARAASLLATAPVSEGGGSLCNTKAATPPAVASSGMSGAQTTTPSAPVIAAREVRNMEGLTMILRKELRPSDVGYLGRVVLPKKDAELRLPPLATREGVSIQMEDFDSGHAWNLRYRFWPNNKSRMYILENTAAFVTSHDLVEGDLLVIYRVLQGGYVLRGAKKRNGGLDIEPVQGDFAYSSARGSLEGSPSLPENGTPVDQRLYGCCPSDKSVKEEPVNLDDDPFLDEVILSMNPSGSSCIQTLEWFPSLTLDFPL